MSEGGERPGLNNTEDRPPEAGLTATLWLIAIVLAIIELVSWFSHRMIGA